MRLLVRGRDQRYTKAELAQASDRVGNKVALASAGRCCYDYRPLLAHPIKQVRTYLLFHAASSRLDHRVERGVRRYVQRRHA